MKKSLMPYVARLISSPACIGTKRFIHEFKRKVAKNPHTLHIFLRIDDPYSYLLVQIIDSLSSRFHITIEYHTIFAVQSEMYPELEMWRKYATRDARLLAQLYHLSFPQNYESKDDSVLEYATALLVKAEKDEHYLTTAKNVFEQVWQEGNSLIPQPNVFADTQVTQQLAANDALLKKMGHYFSAMVYYAGEWYWGVDRLDHLEERLIALGVYRGSNESIRFNRTYKDFCKKQIVPDQNKRKPLTLYWSARSPYSYIALQRAIKLSEFYGIRLDIKPVLPMLMRGFKVPQVKKMYIFFDTKREAKKLGLPYGFVADPLGSAVERCYALFEYAIQQNKRDEFLLSFATGVNAEGIRAETDAGLKRIVERCGLNWLKAKSMLANTDWTQWARQNLNEMYAMQCWGVPSFRYGDEAFWGQDRIGLIEQAIIHDLN